ncbi:MAG: hypothetical protein Q7K28_00725 [Candidatus Wildermuthbacteria bacterium]|nr:hypothetical protein [Candidatus Wildermuthbacteria bacterium]
MQISKKKILLGIPIALMSFEIYLGIIFGYLTAKFFSGKKTGQSGKLKSLVFDFGDYKIHLHHWLCGLGVLISVVVLNFSPPFPQISFGFLTGFIFQGIISYSDWHKILKRES